MRRKNLQRDCPKQRQSWEYHCGPYNGIVFVSEQQILYQVMPHLKYGMSSPDKKSPFVNGLFYFGSPARTRTTDMLVNPASAGLYR